MEDSEVDVGAAEEVSFLAMLLFTASVHHYYMLCHWLSNFSIECAAPL